MVMIHTFVLYWLTKLQTLQRNHMTYCNYEQKFFELDHIYLGW